ncbi:glycerate kinase [Seonamhaeicola sp. S2-3]|uniref:glycerate kinase n=1 Tax=Seonamhaeicola sp. S2-3 TaxID=1936081 RepID=UPI0009729C8A|nr:glycerate kinase [Seonamhaeicola sp. S2-3]APY10650.1 glycerate kinase [Seonamhaeicola sp. S2-3]
MEIIVAPDKFKNSLTGIAFCNAVEEGVKSVIPEVEILKLPLADGGDGTIDVVNYYLKGNMVKLMVNNPFFEPVEASYLYSEDTKIAFIEMAEASGVKLLKPQQFNCKNASTFGTGELIKDALNKGVKHIILGIGGSATNDCGIGMASALGFQFFNANNKEVKPIGANLSEIKKIEVLKAHPKLLTTKFSVACDVTNPLYGKNGAAYVYAAQKGATESDIKMLDKGLQDFSKLLETTFKVDVQSVKGAGAAGGMGIASKLFLNGELTPGITLIKNLANFDTKISKADWIITGEGKLDTQTMSGKTIQGVLTSAKAQQIKVAAFCGSLELSKEETTKMGINYASSVIENATDLDDAMKNSYNYVKQMAETFALSFLRKQESI